MLLFYFKCRVFVLIKNKHRKLLIYDAFLMGKLRLVLFSIYTIITVT